ncbi:SHOCT domain-containing protein [Paractinoplanes brasiliensis]|uniref:Phospholipase D-like protein n=1 Tax=Paractinoplanes brasiliensis TaxID=52695 RepID=A0A4V3C682_9ACTN|nr:SHOCT domain-containing protein [Actinoplanes brasiliensis]TDO32688.1 phospholipase D-like protein [Actinoplanes brasiliensis]GID32821.1 membrane protein [Actinoplanes brasiliensis]
MFDDNGSFLLATLEFFIFFAWFMGLFWIFGDLFRSRDLGGVAKTFWTLFLIILPLLGMLVYLIARGGGMTDRALSAHAEAQRRQETYIRSVASDAGAGTATRQITEAKALLDSGAITADEFERLKAEAWVKSPVA